MARLLFLGISFIIRVACQEPDPALLQLAAQTPNVQAFHLGSNEPEITMNVVRA